MDLRLWSVRWLEVRNCDVHMSKSVEIGNAIEVSRACRVFECLSSGAFVTSHSGDTYGGKLLLPVNQFEESVEPPGEPEFAADCHGQGESNNSRGFTEVDIGCVVAGCEGMNWEFDELSEASGCP